MEREQAVRLTQNLLRKMVERNGSDLFITRGFPPAIKVDGTIHKATDSPLSADQSAMIVRSIMNDRQIKDYDATKECNFAIAPPRIGRLEFPPCPSSVGSGWHPIWRASPARQRDETGTGRGRTRCRDGAFWSARGAETPRL